LVWISVNPEACGDLSEKDLLEQLTTLFSRLRVQAIRFGSAIPMQLNRREAFHPYIFDNLNQARDENFKIINDAVTLIYSARKPKYTNTVTVEMFFHQVQLETRFQAWRRALD